MTSRYSEEFITEVEDFLASTRMKATDFGRESVGDPNFIRHLRKGRSKDKISLMLMYFSARKRTESGIGAYEV
jgi:2,4-dienoyl-CoA reductase-like NADH-dependent reductase (Old Yellow Enzyme family)